MITSTSTVTIEPVAVTLQTFFVPHARHRSGGVWVVQPTVLVPQQRIRSEAAVAAVFLDYMDNATADDLEGPLSFEDLQTVQS
jgi:hypothetical protein